MMSKMVPLVVIGAALLAVAMFLVITSITEPPDGVGPTGDPAAPVVGDPNKVTEIFNIAGRNVAVTTDQTKVVRLQRDIDFEANILAQQQAEQQAQQQQQEQQQQQQQQDQQQQQQQDQQAQQQQQQQQQVTPVPAAVAGVTFIDYVVVPEDTLYRLTQKHNTTIELMAEHNIAANDLVPGATIRLPIADVGTCSTGKAYVVKPGDTVYKIARANNTTIETIRSLNGLNEAYRINVNQVICLPAG